MRHKAHRIVLQNPGRLPRRIFFDHASLRIGRRTSNLRQPQGRRVYHREVSCAVPQVHRIVRGYCIQICSGHVAVFPQFVLIPARTQYPFSRSNRAGAPPHSLDNFSDRSDILVANFNLTSRSMLRPIQRVCVDIDQSRKDGAALQINDRCVF